MNNSVLNAPPQSIITPATPPPPQAPSHLAIFDLLRGIAALSVCVFHFTTGALPAFKHPVTQFIGHRGYLGVEIFFIISGFIIPYALNKSNYDLSQLKQFLLRRFVRIAPAAYVSMILFILLDYFLANYFHKSDANSYFQTVFSPKLIHNLLFTVPFSQYTWFNGISWTLSIEFEFYLVLSLLFPFINRLPYGLLLVGLALSATYYIPGIPEATLAHYSTLFTIGIATWQYFENKISKKYFIALLILFSLIGIKQITSPPILAGLATVAAILYLRLKNPIASFLGNISYSLYLTHIVIGYSVALLLSRLISTVNLFTTSVVILICVLCSIMGAYLFYRYVETPFARLSSQMFRSKKR